MQYTDPSPYPFSDHPIPEGNWNWSSLVLQDLSRICTLIQDISGTNELNRTIANKLAIVDIMEVLLCQNLVDFFGDARHGALE
jgi:hypothetical protein